MHHTLHLSMLSSSLLLLISYACQSHVDRLPLLLLVASIVYPLPTLPLSLHCFLGFAQCITHVFFLLPFPPLLRLSVSCLFSPLLFLLVAPKAFLLLLPLLLIRLLLLLPPSLMSTTPTVLQGPPCLLAISLSPHLLPLITPAFRPQDLEVHAVPAPGGPHHPRHHRRISAVFIVSVAQINRLQPRAVLKERKCHGPHAHARDQSNEYNPVTDGSRAHSRRQRAASDRWGFPPPPKRTFRVRGRRGAEHAPPPSPPGPRLERAHNHQT